MKYSMYATDMADNTDNNDSEILPEFNNTIERFNPDMDDPIDDPIKHGYLSHSDLAIQEMQEEL